MKHQKLLQITLTVVITSLLLSGVCMAGLFSVTGTSMEPTLADGKWVWVSSYGDSEPSRGDMIVFKTNKLTYLKRVIGLPNEKIMIQDGVVYIERQPNQPEKLDEPYLAPGMMTEPDGEFVVPRDSYFVLGDNRNSSRDSRFMGCISKDEIVGKVTKIFK